MSFRQRFVSLLVLLWVQTVLASLAYAQERAVIFVYDAQSGVPIEQANVTNLVSGVTQVTDAGGYCRLSLSENDRIAVSHVAFRDTVLEFRSAAEIIRLGLHAVELGVVEVYAGEAFNKKAAQGLQRVSLPFLTATPSFLGEADIIKGLTFLPGVSDGKEGYSHLFVRGGDQDQNQILLDGATLFNINHFGGFISMFQQELVGGVDFYKSYWPSKFGGRLSSVLDIRTKEGNYKEHRRSYQFGLIAPKMSASGPIIRDKLSYHVGVRRTIVDLVTGATARKIRNQTRVGSVGNLLTGDVTARLDARLGSNQHVSLSGLYGRDKYSFVENSIGSSHLAVENYGIKNELLALNYKINLGLSTSLHAHASYTQYRHVFDDYNKQNEGINYVGYPMTSRETNRLSGNSVRTSKYNIHGKTQFGDALTLNYGVEREELDFGIYLHRKEAVNGSVTNDFNGKVDMDKVSSTAVSADLSYRLGRRIGTAAGARLFNYTNTHQEGAVLLEPKVLLTYELDSRSTLHAAFNLQRQHTMLLGFTDGLGRFREFYISNDGQSPVASSKQWSLGYFRNTLGVLDNVSIELFYKDQHNAVKYMPSVDLDKDVLNYHGFLHREGAVRTYGLEVLLQKTTGRLHGSLAYSYAHAQSRFATLNAGNWFDSDFDFRHSVGFLMMYSFGKGYKLSGNWTYKSGRPFTMPGSRVDIDDWRAGFYVMDDINNMRMPAFHRLDVNLERRWKTAKGNTNWFGIGVYNVYNRVNPFFVQPAETPGKLEMTGMFPIIPFFNIGFEL